MIWKLFDRVPKNIEQPVSPKKEPEEKLGLELENLRAPEIKSDSEFTAAIEEYTIRSFLLRHMFDNLVEWGKNKPKDLITKYIQELGGTSKIISKEEALELSQKIFLEGKGISAFVHSEPTILEAYLLFLVSNKNEKVLEFDEIEETSTGENFLPVDSIRCIRDEIRTKKFIKSIELTVTKKLEEKENVLLCDAGCGALPIFAISAMLKSEKVKCICLESNEYSAKIAETLIQALGLSDRCQVICGDILKYTPENKFDIIVSETMDSGLLNEPECQIIDHLKNSLQVGGQIIPQKIQNFAALIPAEVLENTEKYIQIDDKTYPLFPEDTKWTEIGDYESGKDISVLSGSLGSSEAGQYYIFINSRIVLSDEESIEMDESRISSPKRISDLIALNTGEIINIKYFPGNNLEDVEITKTSL